MLVHLTWPGWQPYYHLYPVSGCQLGRHLLGPPLLDHLQGLAPLMLQEQQLLKPEDSLPHQLLLGLLT